LAAAADHQTMENMIHDAIIGMVALGAVAMFALMAYAGHDAR
jgi:hypothetical protein